MCYIKQDTLKCKEKFIALLHSCLVEGFMDKKRNLVLFIASSLDGYIYKRRIT
jgi:hypothetical protein